MKAKCEFQIVKTFSEWLKKSKDDSWNYSSEGVEQKVT